MSRQIKFLRKLNPRADKKVLWETLMRENEAGKAANSVHVPYLPDGLKGSVQKELESNPFQFLQPMFDMNLLLESQEGVRTFALLPVRHGFIPRSIRITTNDFAKLVRQVGLEVPQREKKEEIILTDADIFIKYKQKEVNKIIQI